MSSPEILLHQFTEICTGSSTNAIKTAENKLLELQKDLNFLTHCLAILTEPQVQYSIRKLVAIYFEKYSKRMSKQKNTSKTISAVHFFLSILINPSIELNLKIYVEVALEFVINLEGNRAIKIELGTKLISQLRESINQADENINFSYLILVGKAIFGNFNYSEETRDFIKSTFSEYLVLNQKLLNMAQRCPIEQKQSLLLIYKHIKEYSSLLKTFLKRLGVLDIDATKLLYLVELQQCLTTAISLNVSGNSISSSIFILLPEDIQLSKIINNGKCNYLNALGYFLRLMNTFVKHANLVNSNPLYVKLAQLLQYFVKSTAALLQMSPYYSLPPNSGLLESIDQMFSLFVNCLRINDFYPVFNQSKNELIENVILPCLSLTPFEAQSFYEDPEEFIQSSLQIVERNIKTAAYMQQKREQESDIIKQYETLKTYSADFLSSLCKFQDGTLTHIFQHSLNVLENKINSTYSKSTMLIVIGCLKDHLKERKDLKTKIAQIFMLLLEGIPIPVINQNSKKEEDIEYAYLLLALSKLILGLKEIYPQIISIAFKAQTSEVYKSFVLDMFDELIRIEEGQKYIFDIVVIYNLLLRNSKQVSIHLLDSYFDLIKYNSDVLNKNPHSILEGLKIISALIELEVKKQNPIQLMLNKYWNVIREVGQNTDFIPQLIPEIEEIVLPLVPYIDGIKNFDFEEDILLLITAFVDKGRKVTENQKKMFEIIPKIFYNQYHCRFGQAFHTIQLFIYYGSQVLRNSFNAIEAIVNMSVTSITQLQVQSRPMSESQNCEGVLVLQTLVSKCGEYFTLQLWSVVIKAILSRLQRDIKFRFLSSNLYGLLAMCLVHSYKFSSDEENEVLMTKILSNINVFAGVDYSPKVIITALTELLLLYEAPFISRRFTQILDLTVSMLEFSATKKENMFGQEDEESDEVQYCNTLLLMKNDMKSLDEFNFFKKKIEQLKQMNRDLLVNSIAQFPQTKKKFFIDILTIEKVANVPRKIFKIKK